MWLAELKTTDFNPKKKYTFVVSLGSTEQHGPFLPLGTDTYIHDAIIEKAEKRLPKVIFLPTIPISCSEEHRGFPGSVWFTQETVNGMLCDLCDSLKDYAKHIIFLSWHGGNVVPLKDFVASQQKKYPSTRLTYFDMEDAQTDKKTMALLKGPIDGHAGNTEISMVLAVDSALVQKPDLKKHPKEKYSFDWNTPYVIDSCPTGISDPHPTWVISKQIGKQCIDFHVDLVVREIKKIASK